MKLILLSICLFLALPIFSDNHSFTIEYVPMIATVATGGFGIGVGYESPVSERFSVGGSIQAYRIPSDYSGALTMAGISASLDYFPLSVSHEGLFTKANGGMTYLGAFGEEKYGELEAHYYFPYVGFSSGWRFVLGEKRVHILIQPELDLSFVLPGWTGSGPKGDLEWYGTGVALLTLYPNLVMGVSF